MTPELYQLHAFLEKHKAKTVPEIIEACFSKLRSMEGLSTPDFNLAENLKSLILLMKHLHRPINMSDEITEYVREFLAEVMKQDKRAKHALEVIAKISGETTTTVS